MMDFLTFKTFLSINALIIFYYLGAVILPVGLWFIISWLIRKYDMVENAYKQGKALIWNLLSRKQQATLLIFFIAVFLFMELFWRMLFEFLIAYMQMREALVK